MDVLDQSKEAVEEGFGVEDSDLLPRNRKDLPTQGHPQSMRDATLTDRVRGLHEFDHPPAHVRQKRDCNQNQ